MKNVTPQVQSVVNAILTHASLPKEQQTDPTPEIIEAYDRLEDYGKVGSELLAQFSITSNADSVVIADNAMFTILTAAQSGVLDGMAAMLVSPQDMYNIVCILLGALIVNGTLKDVADEPNAESH
jgi:hypothetical protein